MKAADTFERSNRCIKLREFTCSGLQSGFSLPSLKYDKSVMEVKVKVKLSRYRPGQALGAPGG
jgi:hypothetical protein